MPRTRHAPQRPAGPAAPWLSVIMPVHKGERYLGATLASAAAEQPAGVEFLMYDSCQDDGAARRVADGFSDRLDIRWHDAADLSSWHDKTNRGVADARAPYVASLHHDDLWLPGHLAALRRSIVAYPDAALSIAPSRFIGPRGEALGTWRLPSAPGEWPGATVAEYLLTQNFIAIPSPLIRRDAWLACGGLDETLWYTADWDLYLKLAALGSVVVRGETTTAFRVHGQSLTMTGSTDLGAFRAQHEQVLARHLPMLGNRAAETERRARASVSVNCALAAAAVGQRANLTGAARELLALGPLGLSRYVRQSRIVDRVRPRVRLKLAGAL
ncbi:MAG: glycosyltransferase [Croceibacterium sp.]